LALKIENLNGWKMNSLTMAKASCCHSNVMLIAFQNGQMVYGGSCSLSGTYLVLEKQIVAAEK